MRIDLNITLVHASGLLLQIHFPPLFEKRIFLIQILYA